jgi:hypothetical protein
LEALSRRFEIDRDETSKPYRYSWRTSTKEFTLPTLTAQECLLLALAEQQLKQLLPPRLMKSMAAFFSQAKNQLDQQPPGRQEREDQEGSGCQYQPAAAPAQGGRAGL